MHPDFKMYVWNEKKSILEQYQNELSVRRVSICIQMYLSLDTEQDQRQSVAR